MKTISTIKIAILVIAAASVLMACGCVRNEDSSTVTFTVGGAPSEIDFWQTLVGEFQEQTGIEVNLVRQPTDTDLRRQGLVVSRSLAGI